jgi:hypothetical protein
MDSTLFCTHLNQFMESHGISTDLWERSQKLTDEATELDDAIFYSQGNEAIAKEAADVAIIAFHIMLLCGSNDPLWRMFKKLEEVAARPAYQDIRHKLMEAQRDTSSVR